MSAVDNEQVSPGWRWAPAWVLAFVALWPAHGYAESVLVLGALAGVVRLLQARFRGGTKLLSGPAWALTTVLFIAYWLPEAFSAIDAADQARALREVAVDLRYLPFLWIVASAVANERGCRRTFDGIAVIVAVWTLDALLEALSGTSPLFWGMNQIKLATSGHGMCTATQVVTVDRLGGVLGPCNLKLGIVLASLSPFALHAAGERFGRIGWMLAASLVGLVILLAGARAAWLTYGLVLLWSGWRMLGAKRLLGIFVLGGALLVGLAWFSPPVAERLHRSTAMLDGDAQGVDHALSGRGRIWSAALCMAQRHPINGVGARGFREAFPACDGEAGTVAAWGAGPALHAHQIVLEVLSETGLLGLLLWLAGAAMAWRAWRYADSTARENARPAMLALAVTVFPFNTHLAAYSTFWGGVLLLLAALYAGSLLNRDTT
ncbi:MAG: O-antigen ligase family protein [Thermomonas sp.]